MSVAVVLASACAMAVLVLAAWGLKPLMPSAWQERGARRRSAARAAEVASDLGLVAERDPEIPTTYHLRAPGGAEDAALSMGSPAFPRGLFHVEHRDWMTIRAKGDPRLPEGARIRPPTRTVFDWRDGAPGEPPTLVTPRGAEIVIEQGPNEWVDVGAVIAWIDAFPEGVRLVNLCRESVELRADGAAVSDAREGARKLFALVRIQ